MTVKLGEALVKATVITREQLKLALERQVIFGGRIGTNLVELGIITEKELADFLSQHMKVPAVNPMLLATIEDDVINAISRDVAEKYKVIPFKKDRNRLHVALLDPRSFEVVDELKFITGFNIVPHVITELRLVHAMEKYYGMTRDLRYISVFGKEPTEEEKPPDANKEHLRKVKEEFAGVREKEEIIGILLNEAARVAKRTALFIVKGNSIIGWNAKGISVENFELAIGPPSIFTEVINRKSYYRGPLLRIPGNEPFISLLSGTPQDCCVIPIHIREKIIALLYVDNGNAAVMDAGIGYINNLVTMACFSFEIVILRKKILDL